MSVIVGEKKPFKESYINLYDNWRAKEYCTVISMKEYDGKKKALLIIFAARMRLSTRFIPGSRVQGWQELDMAFKRFAQLSH